MKPSRNEYAVPQKRKQGRPSVFSETVANKIIELAGQGKTDKQIADFMGIHEVTLVRWRKEKEIFRWAVKEAKAKADELVEASLFRSALGYNYYEEATTREGVMEIRKHQPPSATAQLFWLKNRKPKEWRDRIEHMLTPTHAFTIKAGDAEETYDI